VIIQNLNSFSTIKDSLVLFFTHLWLCQNVLAWRSVRSRMRSYTPAWLRCRSS